MGRKLVMLVILLTWVFREKGAIYLTIVNKITTLLCDGNVKSKTHRTVTALEWKTSKTLERIDIRRTITPNASF